MVLTSDGCGKILPVEAQAGQPLAWGRTLVVERLVVEGADDGATRRGRRVVGSTGAFTRLDEPGEGAAERQELADAVVDVADLGRGHLARRECGRGPARVGRDPDA
jgi:hypothetical protein